MIRSIFALVWLLFPVLANADDTADLKAWVKEHSIRDAFPLEGDIPKMSDEEEGKWMACLNSGLFPAEVAYLSDLMVATGRAGNGEQHRALTAGIAGVISYNNSSMGMPKPLSNLYSFVRTWLIIHADPSMQQEPSGMGGMMEELKGLQLPPDSVAKVMVEILDWLDDSNHNQGLTALLKLRCYLEAGGIEHRELQARLFHHNWQIPTWSPLGMGNPMEVRDELNALLKDRPGRVSWATLLFTWSWGNHWLSKTERLDQETLDVQNAK